MNLFRLAPSALAASLVLISTSHAATAQSTNWVQRALGSYESKILSSGSIVSATTTFTQAKDGSLAGSYLMYEADGDVPGVLSACQPVKPLLMRCLWQDKYGKGRLEIKFSQDFSSFAGNWAPGTSKPSYQWNGTRSLP